MENPVNKREDYHTMGFIQDLYTRGTVHCPDSVAQKPNQQKIWVPIEFHSILKELERYERKTHPDTIHDELPEPMRRFFQVSLTKNNSKPVFVHLQVSGSESRTSRSRPSPIKGKAYYSITKPGFFLRNRVKINFLLWTDTIQRYAINDGYQFETLCSVIPLFSSYGINPSKNSLILYYCAAPWFPWAYQESSNISWFSVDQKNARLRVSFHPLICWFDVSFNNQGLISRISTTGENNNRFGKEISFERIVTYSHYQQVEGVWIPMERITTWKLPDGEEIEQQVSVTTIGYYQNI